MRQDPTRIQFKTIDLRSFLSTYYGLRFKGKKALCPFHNDKKPSLEVFQKDGAWGWKCYGCEAKGTIYDFVMRFDRLDFKDAERKIHELLIGSVPDGIRSKKLASATAGEAASETRPATAGVRKIRVSGKPEREHLYHDENGVVVYKKVKYGKGIFPFYHLESGEWVGGKGDHPHVLYRWPEVKNSPDLVLTEGEKDADTLARLGWPATSGDGGKKDEFKETLSCFKEKAVRILYDCGNEKEAEAAAAKIAAVAAHVFILSIPGRDPVKDYEFDITDHLSQFETEKAKQNALLEILAAERRFEMPPTPRRAFEGPLDAFFNADIPEPEPLITGLIRREEFLYVGGVKHSHKTTLLCNMGLYFAEGRSPWLGFEIPKPGRYMLIQQELGESAFRDRLRKAVKGGKFNDGALRRFIPYTTTGDPIKLNNEAGVKRLRALIEKFRPDLLALDYQASFCVGKENDDTAQAALRDILLQLKTEYRIGIVLAHHFSSKRPDDPKANPAELGGWFRGHTCISDSADAQIGLFRLPMRKDSPNLSRKWEDYNRVEITLRNDKWPPVFATEFDGETFLMKISNVWTEAGVKIVFGNVREIVNAHGGEFRLKDLIRFYQDMFSESGGVSKPTVKAAVQREVRTGYLTVEKLEGEKGKPILIKSRGMRAATEA